MNMADQSTYTIHWAQKRLAYKNAPLCLVRGLYFV